MSGDGDWEHCPTCHAARVTACPFCGTSGSDFEPSDDADDVSLTDSILGRPSMVLCPTCDEPFEPEFYRICPWCDFDFGSGKEGESTVRVEQVRFEGRTVMVAFVITALLLAVAAYFALIV